MYVEYAVQVTLNDIFAVHVHLLQRTGDVESHRVTK
jgi:hypothetical protein